jgi:hypothetical protein
MQASVFTRSSVIERDPRAKGTAYKVLNGIAASV